MSHRDRSLLAKLSHVATSTLTAPKKAHAHQTSVWLKIMMAVTGFIFVAFVLVHMYGNLKIFGGPESFNNYASSLRTFGYPYLPHEGLLWILRITLTVAIILHMYSAITLWRRANEARGTAYKAKGGKKKVQTYSARTMRWGGVIIIVFVVYHLLQFTTLTLSVGAENYSEMTPYDRVIEGFSSDVWWSYLIYLIAITMLAMHVRHGVWSGLATLGWNTRGRQKMINWIAMAVAAALIIGFMIPPTAILLGIIP